MSKGKVKMWGALALCLFILFVVVFCAVMLSRSLLSSIESEAGDGKDGDSLSNSGGSSAVAVTEFQVLADPELELCININEAYENTGVCIRFLASIPAKLKSEVDRDVNKTLYMAVMPLDFLEAIDDENSESVDWIAALETAGQPYLKGTTVFTRVNGDDVSYELRCRIRDILISNVNRKFTAVAYVETVDGDMITREYASYPKGESYATIARSAAYMCAEGLTLSYFNPVWNSDEELAVLNSVINASVDLASGLTTPSDDRSTYFVALSDTSLVLSKGEQVTVRVSIDPAVEVPVYWVSADTTVAVSENGSIKAVGVGTTNVYAWVAGQYYTCVVTVTA